MSPQSDPNGGSTKIVFPGGDKPGFSLMIGRLVSGPNATNIQTEVDDANRIGWPCPEPDPHLRTQRDQPVRLPHDPGATRPGGDQGAEQFVSLELPTDPRGGQQRVITPRPSSR